MLGILSALSTTVAEHQAKPGGQLCLQDRCSYSQGRLSKQEDHYYRVRVISNVSFALQSDCMKGPAGQRAEVRTEPLLLPLQMSEMQFSISTVLPVMTPASPSMLSKGDDNERSFGIFGKIKLKEDAFKPCKFPELRNFYVISYQRESRGM